MDCSVSQEIDQSRLTIRIYCRSRSKINLWRLTVELASDLIHCRELIWILFTRDLRAQYRQSLLGYFWLFVPMLSTTIVWMFLSSTRVIQVAETPIPYPAYVLLGSMIWGIFLTSVNQPLNSFNQGAQVFMKLKVPPEAFILAGMSHVAFDTCVRCVMLVPVFMFYGIKPAATAWLFPFSLAGAGLLGMSLGVLMIPLASLYHDVNRFASTFLQFVMYLTPVVYPPPKTGWAALLIDWNPVTHVILSGRDWLTFGNSSSNLIFFAVVAASALLLWASTLCLRAVLPHLVERMGM